MYVDEYFEFKGYAFSGELITNCFEVHVLSINEIYFQTAPKYEIQIYKCSVVG